MSDLEDRIARAEAAVAELRKFHAAKQRVNELGHAGVEEELRRARETLAEAASRLGYPRR